MEEKKEQRLIEARKQQLKEETILDILKHFRKGYSVSEVKKILGMSYNLIEEIYKGLNNPESPYYESDTYNLIEQKKEEKKLKLRDGNKNKPSKIENSVFIKFSSETKKEIILMALSFRLSYKTLAAMFGTTIEDVIYYLENYPFTKSAMRYLNIETINESNRFEIIAYRKATKYWNERKLLIKKINETSEICNNFEEKLKESLGQINNDSIYNRIINQTNELKKGISSTLKNELRELRKQIDDSIVMGTVNKKANELTEEEKNAIARYRPKYGSTSRRCAVALHFSREFIQKLEEELAEKDPIFKGQLDRLNSYWYNEKKKNYDNNIYEEQIPQFGRGGGTR